jgi:hypothetical protein
LQLSQILVCKLQTPKFVNTGYLARIKRSSEQQQQQRAAAGAASSSSQQQQPAAAASSSAKSAQIRIRSGVVRVAPNLVNAQLKPFEC